MPSSGRGTGGKHTFDVGSECVDVTRFVIECVAQSLRPVTIEKWE